MFRGSITRDSRISRQALMRSFCTNPDLFLYAALSESGTFLGESTRGPLWETKYTQLLAAANEQERRRYTRGGKLQTRIA